MSAAVGPVVRADAYDAFIFDLDGVVTRTARVHAAAWKRVFDGFLRERAESKGEPFREFDPAHDYLRYVDGKLRYDGVKSFLESRGIDLPPGAPEDSCESQTICGIGNRKNAVFLTELKEHGVEPYGTTVEFIHRLRAGGLKTAIISSSKNCREVLQAAGLDSLFDVRVDGRELERLGLPGKPAPDMFLASAHRLGVRPDRSAVVEDAIAGVRAARAGGFAMVIGIDRGGNRRRLEEAGAMLVVTDLGEVNLTDRSP